MIRTRYEHKNKTPLDRFNMVKAKGVGAAWIDYVNYSRRFIYVCLGKNKVGVYSDSFSWNQFKTSMPDILLTDKTIVINSRWVLGNAIQVLGSHFANFVKLHSRWDNDGGVDITGQDWLSINGRREIPIGRQWRSHDPMKYNKKAEPLVFEQRNYELKGFKLAEEWKTASVLWLERNRVVANQRSRARYANKKAEERVSDGVYVMEDIFKLVNVSIRSKVIAHFGMDNVLKTLKHFIVDSDTIDGRYYELVEVSIPDMNSDNGFRKGNYLKMINPSTSEIHFEGVPNHGERTSGWGEFLHKNTVKCALSWRDDENQSDYNKPITLT